MKLISLLILPALTEALNTNAFGLNKRVPMKATTSATTRATKLYGEYGASSTSFYTTTEKQDSYDDLDSILEAKCKDQQLQTVIREMLDACADITEALRTALVTVEGSSNTFGDAQLSVDVIADNIMWDACKDSKVIKDGASEEDPIVRELNPDQEYTVCWDPLDGSSIVDNNWAVGTMIGIWPKSTGLIGATGRDQVTSLVALYGPRTTVLVVLDDGVYEFTYGCTPEGCQLPDGSFAPWICSRKNIEISEDCKIFAPANMRAAQELPGYKALLDHYMENKFTLRYSGGLVPDVYQQFTKNQGVFSNPTSDSSPAKLRLAFEAAPFGLLVEKAGGKTSDGTSGGSVLDVKITAVDQRTPLCIGSANEVDRFNDMVCMIN
uniref:Fructose-bisphosphatase n=1 Tax=Triparma pacifica TaxID=91992 RepID=A0A7S2QUK9_9STRA|mmetsp:Transcript_1058/g.1887  ORF Transcript_1058/g.1887 Transcript_1058/m.1887 type:complete len:380 (+) Transcript_1058:133-1272(+)|eukprot:CAMPEP_0118633956 /NCGR_PEP_ID=MMETSP0785-20121206/1278_1 /TAXON_ID=91992 /ORGANISM="Bolidomonas pacifica, Strain CCMP 1866" /LENGTH=379 /DNA_ID=CAMNT_0006524875 /DNA_START=43 /DNA_END=1182 /DNA_ORIENTATION=+